MVRGANSQALGNLRRLFRQGSSLSNARGCQELLETQEVTIKYWNVL